MRKLSKAALILSVAALFSLPAFPQKPPAEEPSHGQGAQYHFRKEDAAKLRQHYDNINRVDTRNRHHLAAGQELPGDWRERMRPVPAEAIRELPPPPAGYVFGYIDGYCVAYDPNSGYIADVIDLTNL